MARQKPKRVRRDEAVAKINDGIAELQALHDELEEWQDNMSAADMEHLPKFDEVSEAVDEIENALSDLECAVEAAECLEFPRAF